MDQTTRPKAGHRRHGAARVGTRSGHAIPGRQTKRTHPLLVNNNLELGMDSREPMPMDVG
eukprot:5919884-Heterocapsa_arctica.AAC.1